MSFEDFLAGGFQKFHFDTLREVSLSITEAQTNNILKGELQANHR